jgi:hypothetical protein
VDSPGIQVIQVGRGGVVNRTSQAWGAAVEVCCSLGSALLGVPMHHFHFKKKGTVPVGTVNTINIFSSDVIRCNHKPNHVSNILQYSTDRPG